jgi:hypothetical protein
MAISEAERDCEEAIKLDPTFIKGYIRKAAVFVAKRDWSKVMELSGYPAFPFSFLLLFNMWSFFLLFNYWSDNEN